MKTKGIFNHRREYLKTTVVKTLP